MVVKVNFHPLCVIFLLLILPNVIIAQKGVAVDTSSLSNWTTVSASDTLVGSVLLYDQAFSKLEFTIDLIAEKTFAKVYLRQDSLSNWYSGKLGLKGHFLVLSRQSDGRTGEFVLFGTGKIKIFPAKLLIQFSYQELSNSLMYGTITISLNKRFFFLRKLVEKEALKTLRYMKIMGKNLFEDRQLRLRLDAWGTTLDKQAIAPSGRKAPLDP